MDNKDTGPGGGTSADDDFGYKLSPEAERTLPEDDKPQWHVATKSGNQFGPWPLVELKRRAENGELAADDLVWRSGMTDWKPAAQLPELSGVLGSGHASAPTASTPAATPASGPAMPPPAGFGSSPYGPPPMSSGMPPQMPGMVEEERKRFADWFGDPDFLRVVSRLSGILSAFWLLLSTTTYFATGFQWFTGALIFFAMFLIVEVLAMFLERQKAISSRLEKLDKYVRKQG